MVWQDTALSIINFGFILTLIPAIIQNYKNRDVKGQSVLTYVSTAVLLSFMSYLFFSLELWLSSVATLGTAITWYILLYQRIMY